ncbi:MAG TPA: efflux RND transporter periplasmic adaptor subunit [Phycisphaerae bacterium]|nr:efflux RND transporter periplasmic adaptor subunit [Phycisphaerae bacterium]
MREERRDYRVAVGAEPADRPISPLRADMVISPQLFYGQLCFVMKDPVTLRYFRLQPVEHFLLTQFNGERTARDLLGLIQQQFPESSLTVQDVLRFVGMLHESHLLVGEGLGHAEWLTKRRSAARRQRWMELAQNFLFFKVPIFHPDRLLTFLDDTIGNVIFNPITGIAAIGLVLVALWNVLMSTDRLANLPYNLLSWQNLLVLYGVFICTKVFHEFGHGLTAKHFGGEVSSMGVMLFVITPSFYCDTSDAWMISSRSARLWINAGGVVVELVIAALATFVWLYTPSDGVINQIALNTMISCSVATLFFNANPLLRYDGYYFLADLLEIPNLMTKGRQLIGYYLQKWVLKLKPQAPPDQGRAGWLVSFAVASTVYKWMVIFGVITLLYYFFGQFGLAPFGILLAVVYVVMTVLWPMLKSMAFVWKQRWDIGKRLAYMGAVAGAAAIILLGVAFMPWSRSIREPLVVLSVSDEPVFVRTPGYVESVSKDTGERVSKGEVIVKLTDPTLTTELEQVQSQRAAAALQSSEALAHNQPALSAAADDAIAAYDKRIAFIQQEIANLTLRAPVDGVIIRDTSLKSVVGNFVASNVALCRVIRTDKLQARLSLPQQQAAVVKPGMPVKIRLWSAPANPIESTVSRVSSEISDQLLHPALSSTVRGDVDVKADAKGQVRSTNRRSTVFVNLPPDAGYLADGMTGRAEIVVDRRTNVAERVWRAILDSTTPDLRL